MLVTATVTDAAVVRIIGSSLFVKIALQGNCKIAGFANNRFVLRIIGNDQSHNRNGCVIVGHIAKIDTAVRFHIKQQKIVTPPDILRRVSFDTTGWFSHKPGQNQPGQGRMLRLRPIAGRLLLFNQPGQTFFNGMLNFLFQGVVDGIWTIGNYLTGKAVMQRTKGQVYCDQYQQS